MKNKRRWLLICLVMTLFGFYFILPAQLFKPKYSTILEDRSGNLLGARIATDGQWRFPPEAGRDTIDLRYIQSVVQLEDKSYYWHFGVN